MTGTIRSAGFPFYLAASLAIFLPTLLRADATPLPEKGIILDVHSTWTDGLACDRGGTARIYGMDMTRPDPRINLIDSNNKALFGLRLGLPIDSQSYPILTLKYRAKNASPKAEYVVRMTHGANPSRQIAKLFTGADLKSDGQVHELTRDLRQTEVTDNIVDVGVGIASDDRPCSIDIVGLAFSSADGQKRPAVVEDSPVKIHVTDAAGAALAGAKVTIDAERVNFARFADTDANGDATIKPLTNDAQAHVVRVEKSGYFTLDRAVKEGTNEIAMVAAVRYGGTARGEGGQIAPRAAIRFRLSKKFQKQLSLPPTAIPPTTTDDKGNWTTPPLPSDAIELAISCVTRSGGDDVSTSTVDSEQSQQPNAPWPAVVVADVAEKSSPTTLAAPGKLPEKTSNSAPTPSFAAVVSKVDDSTISVGWTGIEENQLTAVLHPQPGKDQPVKIPLADITELVLKRGGGASTPSITPTTKPLTALPNTRIVMVNGDRLIGLLTGWSEKRLVVHPNIAPDIAIEIPVKNVLEVWCGSADLVKKAQTLKEQPGVEDIAFAVRGEDVFAPHGVVIGIEGDSLLFRFDNEDRKIALNRVVGLLLAKPDEAAHDDALYEAVQFVNDDQISGVVQGIEGKKLLMQTRGGAAAKLPIDQIARISMRNGRLTYLSDLKPTKVEQIPFFDRVIEYRIDKSLSGRPITLSDGTYPHGISMHAHCVLTYDLEGRYNEFRSKVGFQLPEGKIGDAVIRVRADGKVLYEKLDARGDQPPADLKLKVDGVHELTLEVDYGNNDDVGDRVSFANARLLRAESQ